MESPSCLTLKQKKFVQNYLLTGNSTQAAIEAGYSKKTAYSIGHENLKKPEIQNLIKEIRKESEVKFQISRDQLLKKLWDITEKSDGKDSDKISAINAMAKIGGLLSVGNSKDQEIENEHQSDLDKIPTPILVKIIRESQALGLPEGQKYRIKFESGDFESENQIS